MATERSLERCGIDQFDVLLLHNPDRVGYTSETVWQGMAALRERGLTRLLGVAPGPANGFTLDVIDCFERFGALIDWAMLILNPLEPWPGELALGAASAAGVEVIARVVDYGGMFHDDIVPGHAFRPRRPSDVPPEGLGRAGARATRADAADRAAQRPDDASAGVRLGPRPRAGGDCVAPTLIQESGRRRARSRTSARSSPRWPGPSR